MDEAKMQRMMAWAYRVDANGLLRAYAQGRRDFADAELGGADFAGADLAGVHLDGAYLGGANLGGANLRGADLRGANLGGADLRRANLIGAQLRNADLSDADLRGCLGLPLSTERSIDLRKRVLRQIEESPDTHDQVYWHSVCGTRHCVAGWAVVLAGAKGSVLEARLSTDTAAHLLMAGASRPSFAVTATRDDIVASLRASIDTAGAV